MNRFFVILAISLLSPAVSALNFSFLKNSALSRFSKKDMSEFRSLVSESMTSAQDGQVVEWQSGSGNHRAKILFRATYIDDGTATCRRVLFKISDGNRSPENYRFDLCNSGETWNFAQTSVSSFTTDDWTYLSKVAEDVLNNENDGSAVSWFFRKTGNSGVVTPLTTFMVDGYSCRDTAFSIINREGQTFDGNYTLCKRDTGEWKILGR
jgi:surface antigen